MRTRSLIAIACALAVSVPAGLPAGAHPDPHRQQLERIEQEIEKTQEKIAEAEEERKGLLTEISASDQRRDELTGRISQLSGELSSAESTLAEVQASLDLTREELRRWTRRLDGTRKQLSGQKETLGARAAAVYKLGAAGMIDVVFGAEDLGSLTDRVEFVTSVLDADQRTLTGIRVTRQQLASQQERIEEFEAALARDRDRIRQEVARIQGLKAEQEALRVEVDEEITTREGLLEDVEAEKAKWVQAVKELEAESARVAAQIQSTGSSGSGNPNAQLHWPAPGSITSGFGWREHPIFGERRFHAGVDINAGCGAPISSGESGQVLSAGWSGGYGLTVVVDHGDGLSTLYAHQSEISVSAGQQVSRAELIGSVGTTGWSTGCHLHFEVRVNGEPVDPVPYLS